QGSVDVDIGSTVNGKVNIKKTLAKYKDSENIDVYYYVSGSSNASFEMADKIGSVNDIIDSLLAKFKKTEAMSEEPQNEEPKKNDNGEKGSNVQPDTKNESSVAAKKNENPAIKIDKVSDKDKQTVATDTDSKKAESKGQPINGAAIGAVSIT